MTGLSPVTANLRRQGLDCRRWIACPNVLKLQLLDELQIALIPTILGEGIPLFPAGTAPENLTLTHTERMGQIVMLHYQTLRS